MRATRKRPPTSAEIQKALDHWAFLWSGGPKNKRPEESARTHQGEENKSKSDCDAKPTTAQTTSGNQHSVSCAKRAAVAVVLLRCPASFKCHSPLLGPSLVEGCLMRDHREEFRQAIAAAGLTPPDTIEPTNGGRPKRFATNGQRGDDAGWYVYFEDERPAGAFGCHRTGIEATWSAKADTQLTPNEREAFAKRMQEAAIARAAEHWEAEAKRRQLASEIWGSCEAAPEDHGYLHRKGIRIARPAALSRRSGNPRDAV